MAPASLVDKNLQSNDKNQLGGCDYSNNPCQGLVGGGGNREPRAENREPGTEAKPFFLPPLRRGGSGRGCFAAVAGTGTGSCPGRLAGGRSTSSPGLFEETRLIASLQRGLHKETVQMKLKPECVYKTMFGSNLQVRPQS